MYTDLCSITAVCQKVEIPLNASFRERGGSHPGGTFHCASCAATADEARQRNGQALCMQSAKPSEPERKSSCFSSVSNDSCAPTEPTCGCWMLTACREP